MANLTAADIDNMLKTNARNATNTFAKDIRIRVQTGISVWSPTRIRQSVWTRTSLPHYKNFTLRLTNPYSTTSTFNGALDSSIAPGSEITAAGISNSITNAMLKSVNHIENSLKNASFSHSFCHCSCHNNCHGSRGRR